MKNIEKIQTPVLKTICQELNFSSLKELANRYAAAIKLLKSGISIYDISKHFRHTEVAMTEQYLKSLQGYASGVMVEGFPDF